jgi:hypothetical protein
VNTVSEVDVFRLCEAYDEEGYGLMEEDATRNEAYQRAIQGRDGVCPLNLTAVPAAKKNWLEIGCGGSAFLSRLVLDHHPEAHLTAFEINKKSAATSQKILRREFGMISETLVLRNIKVTNGLKFYRRLLLQPQNLSLKALTLSCTKFLDSLLRAKVVSLASDMPAICTPNPMVYACPHVPPPLSLLLLLRRRYANSL